MSHASMRSGAAAVALFATLAAAQPGPGDRLEGKLDPKTFRVVSLLVDSAHKADLPTEPLIDKALEGASKHAAGPRIIEAVRGVSDALTRARKALGSNSTPEELKAGAAALRSGVPVEQLQRLRSARAGYHLAAAINVMDDLINRNVPSDTAANLMHALVHVAATDEQLFRLKAQIEADILNGAPPAAVASARAAGLTEMIVADLPPGSGGASGSALPSGRNQAGKAGTSLAPQAAGSAVGSRAAGEAPAGPPAPNVPPRGKPKQRRP